jgi:hypothetical protein
MSGLSIKPFATRWKPVVLKGLGNKEVTAVLEAAAPSTSTLPKVITASIAQIKIGLFMQSLILCLTILQFLYT